ncbi:hypothetical protein ACA910_003693 [Epithemia clementina (nom. ined.)]
MPEGKNVPHIPNEQVKGVSGIGLVLWLGICTLLGKSNVLMNLMVKDQVVVMRQMKWERMGISPINKMQEDSKKMDSNIVCLMPEMEFMKNPIKELELWFMASPIMMSHENAINIK